MSLKQLFRKWTTAVRAIEISIGKKSMNIGVSMVPKPKPEKKVSIDPKSAKTAIKIKSIKKLMYL